MQRVIAILGPTASGKSALALATAARLPAEIVACDALMVYRGFDVGTNKPTPAERARVPHHLLDVCQYDEQMQAARYSELALAAVHAIHARGRTPILVVGTYLYYRALVYGLGPLPEGSQTLREELVGKGAEWIAAECARVDPASYAEANGKNLPRMVRAVEVFILTGKPASELRRAHGFTTPRLAVDAYVLAPERAALHARINARVRQMWESGWRDEVLRLLDAGVPREARAMQAVGYRDVAEWIVAGGSEAELLERIAAQTRQYARRQSSFFKQETSARVLRGFGEDERVA